MKLEHLNYHVCPECRSGVLIFKGGPSSDGRGLAVDGEIACGGCGAKFAVRGGIPRFVPAGNYADSFGYQWNIHAKTQLDSYSGMSISRNRLFGVTGWPQDLRGQSILEAGSGAGRFTEVLVGTGASVVSFDYSAAVDANYANNGHRPNLHLFQGDIFRIPLREAAFDKVLCLGVLQHTPEPAAAFQSLARYVRPGGHLVIDVYTRRLLSVLQWKYALRPITKHLGKETLYRLVQAVVPVLIPIARTLRRIGGPAVARLVPIVEYSHLDLPPELNAQWAALDTFDMYSPAHDHPQSLATVREWYQNLGFKGIDVRYGPNGVIGSGVKPG